MSVFSRAGRHRPSLPPLALAVLLVAAGPATGCSDAFGARVPLLNPGLEILGALPADSVQAIIRDPLTVMVADAAGRPLSEVRVVISSAPRIRPIEEAPPPILFSTSSQAASYSGSVAGSTDARGELRVWVRYGSAATEALMLARTTDSRVAGADSLATAITPGSPTQIRMSPLDTATFVGRSYTLRARSFDRFGNATGEQPYLSSSRPDIVQLDHQHEPRGMATGRAYIIAQSGEVRDSVAVSVVPTGTLLVYQYSRHSGYRPTFYTFDLDGSNYRSVGDDLRGFNNRSPYFLPDGESVVFHGVPPWGSSLDMTLYRMDLQGRVETVFAPSDSVREAYHPQPSRDGEWIYFAAVTGYERTEIWRVRADGSDAAAVGLDSQYEPLYGLPSPSPDGRRLAVVRRTHSALSDSLGIFDLQTGTLRNVAGYARRPRWSPVADEIAYFGNGGIRIVRSDGTPLLGPFAHTYGLDEDDGQIDWSPDGEWLVTCTTTGTSGERFLLLVRRSDGEVLPLAHTKSRNLCGATWRP